MRLGKIAFRNIKRNKKRSILSIVATAIATFSISFMFAYMEGLIVDMEDMAFNYDTGQVLIRNKTFDDKIFSLDRAVDDYKDVVALLKRELPELYVAPRLSFPSTVLDVDRDHVCYGIAVDFDIEDEYLGISDMLVSGRFPESPREVVIGIGLANELELNIGDKFTPITMTRKGASSGITFTVSGMGKFTSAAYTNKSFIAPLTEIPEILKMKGAVSQIFIKGIPDKELEVTADRMNKLLQDSGYTEIEALTWKDVGLSFTMIRLADITYTIMAFFFFILASTVIANTMLMVVFERRKEIGTITAMGMDGNEVVRLFFLEALVLGVLGAGFGIILSVLVVVPLSIIGIDFSDIAESFEMGSSFVIYPLLTVKSTVVVFLYSVFVASFISFFPSRSAVKVDPVVALRSE